MKNRLIFVVYSILASSLLFECCTKECDLPIESNKQIVTTFSVDQILDGAGTKSFYDGSTSVWEADDSIGIYPNAGSQLFFVIGSGAGSSSVAFDGGGWAFRPGSVYYSYYPFIADFHLDRKNIPVSYVGERQSGLSNADLLGDYDYMYTGPTEVVDDYLRFEYHHLSSLIHIDATLDPGTYKQLTITAPSDVFIKKGHFDLTAEHPSIIADELDDEMTILLDNVTLDEKQTILFYLYIAPVNLNGVEIVVSILNSEKEQFDCTKTPSREYQAGSKYGLTCNIWTKVQQSVTVLVEDWGEGSHTDDVLQ